MIVCTCNTQGPGLQPQRQSLDLRARDTHEGSSLNPIDYLLGCLVLTGCHAMAQVSLTLTLYPRLASSCISPSASASKGWDYSNEPQLLLAQILAILLFIFNHAIYNVFHDLLHTEQVLSH